MLSSATPVAFLASTDLDRSRHFYEGLLGLRVVHADAFAVVIDANGIALRITNVGVEFLQVDGLQQDAAGVWTTPDGSQVAWFKDPDGNTLSLSQQ